MFWVHGHCFPCPESAPQPDTGGRAENDSVPLCRSGKDSVCPLDEKNDDLSAYSARGDARLFLGNFEGSREDYEKMIQLNPKLDVSHWRLGIAYFYLKEYDKAARQFKVYHNYDQVDRENGIWRFMSQYKASGLNTARKGLLKYEKDDRPPYPWLYDMFAGKIKPGQVFSEIEKAEFDDLYKTRVLFHAWLRTGYILSLPKERNRHCRTFAKLRRTIMAGQPELICGRWPESIIS